MYINHFTVNGYTPNFKVLRCNHFRFKRAYEGEKFEDEDVRYSAF